MRPRVSRHSEPTPGPGRRVYVFCPSFPCISKARPRVHAAFAALLFLSALLAAFLTNTPAPPSFLSALTSPPKADLSVQHGLLGPALRAGPSPHARRAAAGGRAPGSRPAPHRSAPRDCAPGPGSPSRSRDLRAARRARAPLGPPRRPPARAHELTPRGRGGDFFVRSRSHCESAAGTSWVPLRRHTTSAPRAGGGAPAGPDAPAAGPGSRDHTKGTGWRLLVRSRSPTSRPPGSRGSRCAAT